MFYAETPDGAGLLDRVSDSIGVSEEARLSFGKMVLLWPLKEQITEIKIYDSQVLFSLIADP